ncbi:MAG TPA: SDR family NAD(P)-dependent oxidoreductase [Solirubrobacteraceae bacterium]|nr:SDR family NAD(P)-dependent oxidoreductase [Solirubrobacteraceae bacterium]
MPETSKAVLITGCSTGIGRATAERLARAGHTVYASARNEATLQPLRELGARTLALDVCDEDSMRSGVEHVVSEQGAVGVLINNAGYSQDGAIECVPMDAVQRQFQTNVFGLIRMCQLVLPGMRAQRFGRIVNVSSMGANFTFPGAGLYHATKYAVEAISDALRFEVRDFGVGVTVIQPGLIRTNFGEAAAQSLEGQAQNGEGQGGVYDRFNQDVARMTVEAYHKGPLARFGGEPDAVAKAIEKAITRGQAPIRVRVTVSARMLIAQRRMMGAGMWDRFLATQFTRPAPD